MPWLRSRRRFTPPPTAPVPATEVVRVAALRASWRRDRWVSQRRLWFRWTLWGMQRYAWQISGFVLTLALLGWWWLAGVPQPSDTPTLSEAPSSNALPAPPSPPASSLDTDPLADATPLPLRLDTTWGASAAPVGPAPVTRSDTDVNTFPIPDLKPENWLHSKEP